jgi:hypothetical protein
MASLFSNLIASLLAAGCIGVLLRTQDYVGLAAFALFAFICYILPVYRPVPILAYAVPLQILAAAGILVPGVDSKLLCLSALVASWIAVHVGLRRIPPVRSYSLALCALATIITLVVWSALLSITSFWIPGAAHLPGDRTKLNGLSAKSQFHGSRVGLALSGGGFRAALMHAGVLSGLEDLGVVPTHISAVSGGSIIATYYALGGRPRAFVDAVKTGRFNLKRELLKLHNTIRLPLPGTIPFIGYPLSTTEFSRTDVQIALLRDTLFGRTTLQDVSRSALPRLMLCATDLHRGAAVGITPTGMMFRTIRN